YIDAAATNNNISTLKLKKALEKTISPSTNPHTLAHIILYYNIQNRSTKFSISQIQQDYELKHYIEAQN
ncbi:32961_t:CDS:1, partial [Gigaspora margarita]